MADSFLGDIGQTLGPIVHEIAPVISSDISEQLGHVLEPLQDGQLQDALHVLIEMHETPIDAPDSPVIDSSLDHPLAMTDAHVDDAYGAHEVYVADAHVDAAHVDTAYVDTSHVAGADDGAA